MAVSIHTFLLIYFTELIYAKIVQLSSRMHILLFTRSINTEQK